MKDVEHGNEVTMRVLIAGSPSKLFHLKEFGDELIKHGSDYKLVVDTDIYTSFPSRKISNWFDTKKKFNSLISNYKPDLVFLDRQTRFGLATVDAKIPLLVHLRGDYWSEIKWARETLYKDPIKKFVLNYKNKIAEKCFNESTMILPICKYLKTITDSHYPNKSNVLYQGIDPTRWYEEAGMELKHPCVGLLQDAKIWGKAKEMLILKKVLKAKPNVFFYWAGDGPYRDEILKELNQYENFKWLGSLEYPNKVRQFLSEIDIYTLITGIDMSPLTLQEAQLMKKPIIATNVGGVSELMQENKTGFLVEKGNSEQIIEKLEIFLNDLTLVDKMGKEARDFVEKKFAWNKICEEFLNFTKPILK